MAKKNKVRIDRIIILILSGLLVGGAIGFGIYKLIDLFKTPAADKPVTPVETNQGSHISLNDYTIYYDDTNELGFNFIIADIKITSNENVSFGLDQLNTSEKINLNDVSKYTNKMDMAGYDLSKLNISTSSVIAEANNVDVKVFIPYATDSSNLSIYNSANKTDQIIFDLTKTPIAATSLKLNDNNEEIVVGDTSVYVSKAYISTFMLHNGEPYEISSSSRMYSFEISVKQAKDNVKITDAIFIKAGTSDEKHCKPSDYEAIDMDNILDTNLSIGAKGGLFFEIYSNEDVVEKGTLLIKFSNSDAWVEVSTISE